MYPCNWMIKIKNVALQTNINLLKLNHPLEVLKIISNPVGWS